MPTYQYACKNPDCLTKFERVQAFTDAAISQCPVCGQAVRKVYGSVGVVFKGSGFYRNDSRDAATAAEAPAKAAGDASESKGSESRSGSDTQSAPESKGDSKPSSDSAGSATPKDSGSKAAQPPTKPAPNGSESSPSKSKAAANS